MTKVEIYTFKDCFWCRRAKELFKEKGINSYTEIEVKGKDDPVYIKLKEKTGQLTVPQIFFDDKFIGGYDKLVERFRDIELNN